MCHRQDDVIDAFFGHFTKMQKLNNHSKGVIKLNSAAPFCGSESIYMRADIATAKAKVSGNGVNDTSNHVITTHIVEATILELEFPIRHFTGNH